MTPHEGGGGGHSIEVLCANRENQALKIRRSGLMWIVTVTNNQQKCQVPPSCFPGLVRPFSRGAKSDGLQHLIKATTHLKASSRARLPWQNEGCRKWGTGEAASSKPSSKAKKAFCMCSLPWKCRKAAPKTDFSAAGNRICLMLDIRSACMSCITDLGEVWEGKEDLV